jgi:acyl dehydratase
MEAPELPRRITFRPKVGQKLSFRRTLTEGDAALFVGVTWDINPYHTDETFAGQTRFGRRIVPGLLTASLLTHIGGLLAFLAQEMYLEFLAPVYIGETILAECEIVEVDEGRGWIKLRCRCANGDGREVLRAAISGFPGRFVSEVIEGG